MLEGWMWEMASAPILDEDVSPRFSCAVMMTSLMVKEERLSGYCQEPVVSGCEAPPWAMAVRAEGRRAKNKPRYFTVAVNIFGLQRYPGQKVWAIPIFSYCWRRSFTRESVEEVKLMPGRFL